MDIKLRHPFDGTVPISQAFETYDKSVIDHYHLTGAETFHYGLDFAMDYGTKVLAADKGYVYAFGEDSRNGKFIIIDHNNGFMTHYYHLSQQLVYHNQLIARGQLLGLSGNTGRVTGSHLHFQLNQITNGVNKRIDPSPYFGEYVTPVEIVEAPKPQVEAVKVEQNASNPSTDLVIIGNTGNPQHPGVLNSLSAIAKFLGLPDDTDSYEKILNWNPTMRRLHTADATTNYSIIPADFDVKSPKDWKYPTQVQVPVQSTYRTHVMQDHETLSGIYKYYFNGAWGDEKTSSFLDFISTHNAPAGFNKNNPGFVLPNWKFTIPNNL